MINPSFRKAFLIVLIFFLSLILSTFILRDIFVSSIIFKKIDQFNHTYHAGLKVEKIRVRWLASIMMTGITVKPDKRDTILRLDTAYVSVNGWKLLTGRLVLQDLILKDIRCSLVRKGKEANYDFLFLEKERRADPIRGEINYALAADRLTGLLFDKIPRRVRIGDLEISLNTNGHVLSLHIDRFSIEDHSFRSVVMITENDVSQSWIMQGMVERDSRKGTIRIYPDGTGKCVLPFLAYKWDARVEFDTVLFRISEAKLNDSLTKINGTVALSGFDLDHKGISSRHVYLEKLSVSHIVNIGADYIELDSATGVNINFLDFHPYIRYKTRPAKQVTLKLHQPSFAAEDLFTSLPRGLFYNLEGIKVKGELSYDLDFFVDLSVPDSLFFNSELKRHHFTVISYGDNDLMKINAPFQYTAYEKGEPVRTFMVGPENPDFRPIERISPYLKASILTSEDPGFYQHRGFIGDAFRESIITDIKERKFARGGSTISMQLIKNVFLNRNKNFARKFEEILLVWLIENQGLSTKDRMFEVYLNIIEWGPLIYGANEAARFYFKKDASRLNLAESIFLASIIPRPKWFRYSFDREGHISESQAGYFTLLSEKMLKRGLINQADYDQLIPDVELRGPARLLLKKRDTIQADSLFLPEE